MCVSVRVRGVLCTQSHRTPSVVFSKLNINMGTAIPRATNGKNRSTLGAIFSAARAARAAKFGRLVVLKKSTGCQKIFRITTSGFELRSPFEKTIFSFFSKIRDFFENIFIPFRRTIQYTQRVKIFSGLLLPVSEPRPLEERYPNRKKSTKFDAELRKKRASPPIFILLFHRGVKPLLSCKV